MGFAPDQLRRPDTSVVGADGVNSVLAHTTVLGDRLFGKIACEDDAKPQDETRFPSSLAVESVCNGYRVGTMTLPGARRWLLLCQTLFADGVGCADMRISDLSNSPWLDPASVTALSSQHVMKVIRPHKSIARSMVSCLRVYEVF